jgi:hypothetical protein
MSAGMRFLFACGLCPEIRKPETRPINLTVRLAPLAPITLEHRTSKASKILKRSPVNTHRLPTNPRTQATPFKDKMFHQRQTTSTDAPIAQNAQDAPKKALQGDQSPHSPILMNSTSLITLDNADDRVLQKYDLTDDSHLESAESDSEYSGFERASWTEPDEEDLDTSDDDPCDPVIEVVRPEILKPNDHKLETIDLLVSDLVHENLHHGCRNRYEFDWLNLRAYADNWDCLDYEMRKTIRAFADSDLCGNNLKHGMKRPGEFHRHLLLLAGCEIWNIREYQNTNMVLSNLKDKYGNYSKEWTKERWIDARDCNQAAHEFHDKYDPSILFRDFNAQIIQFEASADYRHQPNPGDRERARFKRFFRENAAILKRWSRSKLIYSYIYSHEISCDSILGMRFRPHTHAIVFFKKSPIAPDFESRMRHTDRKVTTTEQIHTRYETIEKFIRYVYGAYSLVDVYKRERRDDNLPALNKTTVQALRAIIELTKGNKLERAIQRNNHSYIPKKLQNQERWCHPLLKVKKKQ